MQTRNMSNIHYIITTWYLVLVTTSPQKKLLVKILNTSMTLVLVQCSLHEWPRMLHMPCGSTAERGTHASAKVYHRFGTLLPAAAAVVLLLRIACFGVARGESFFAMTSTPAILSMQCPAWAMPSMLCPAHPASGAGQGIGRAWAHALAEAGAAVAGGGRFNPGLFLPILQPQPSNRQLTHQNANLIVKTPTLTV